MDGSQHHPPATPRGDALADYIAGAAARAYPETVREAGIRALVDFVATAVGSYNEACSEAVRRTALSWHAQGKARMFLSDATTPALAALVNSTMAHAMDFDDTHTGGAGHASGPCWSTALAVAQELGADEKTTFEAFLTGFEVMAKLGSGGPPGVGRSLQRRGLHPTSVFGRVGAAAATSVLMGLDRQQISYALGAAATTSGGLLGSFGTHSKPFHSGKTAMDGILAAQLARDGFVSATQLYELEKGLLDAFIQDREVEVPPLDFEDKWEILDNAFKPFASCRATHPSTQAARSLAEQLGNRKVSRVHAQVHPNAVVTAGKTAPRTPLEGKFSVPYCISLALSGYPVQAPDFSEGPFRNPRVQAILPTVELEPVSDQMPWVAHLDVFLEDGATLHADTDIVMGHPDNPMSWDDLKSKFMGLVVPVTGATRADELYAAARAFLSPGGLPKLMALLEPNTYGG